MTKVDIIIPIYRNPHWLKQACESVVRQTYTLWSAFLVSDDAEPAVLEVAQNICSSDPRFHLIHTSRPAGTHAGPWHARNTGIQESSSEFIAFLDSDDIWHPCKLEKQIDALFDSSDLCVSAYYRFRDRNMTIVESRMPPHDLFYRDLFKSNPLPLSTVVIRRKLIDFDPVVFRPEFHEDYGLWLRLFKSRHMIRYVCIPRFLMAYRIHKMSLSASRHLSIFSVYHLFRLVTGNGLLSLYYIACWALVKISRWTRQELKLPMPDWCH